jgi:hypothetical protein
MVNHFGSLGRTIKEAVKYSDPAKVKALAMPIG